MSVTVQFYAHYLSTCEKETIRFFMFVPLSVNVQKKTTPDEG